jgi:two-component system CheB/CheR fusion protein
MKVLVVDDHHDTAVLLSRILTIDGYEVHGAESYAQAMQIAQQIRVEILVSDIDLADGDGCNLLAEVRAMHPDVRGIAFTGHGMATHRDRYSRAGFQAVLIKPVSLTEIREEIARLVEPISPDRLPDEGVEPTAE